MRKFVVSDLCGDQRMYDLIISYLENVSLIDDVLLIINGNLINHDDFYELLEDVYERTMKNESFQIKYLGGSQELRIYQEKGDFHSFLGDLDISYESREYMCHRPIVITSGDIPKKRVKIRDNNSYVIDAVSRKLDLMDRNFATRTFRGIIGRNGYRNEYFMIKGNCPIDNDYGFFYNAYEHYLTIDGGCGKESSFPHVPLVEIEENKLTILIFNDENEITSGFVLEKELKELDENELERKRCFLGNGFYENRMVKELRK